MPSLPSTAGSRVRVAASTATTESMMPSAMERNAGTGHQQHRRQRHQHGDAGEGDGLARGGHGLGDGIDGGLPVDRVGAPRAGEGGAEPDDEEQRVVDAQREGEHHREVQRPDADRRDVGGDDQRAGGSEQADQGEHQRQAGGDQAAEGDHQHDHGDRPGQHLGFDHRGVVDLVEVRPQRAVSRSGSPTPSRSRARAIGPVRSSAARTIAFASPARRPGRPRSTVARQRDCPAAAPPPC